ncbi:MAG: TetR/AcrR family transcriptional regulator C-terminal domain-containing protein [Selenomonadaceae bacterium]|nr:TetR/AcrR family transcriptional regulator C-terminal domain-containing protein [Selenomonadaceae bacterium]
MIKISTKDIFAQSLKKLSNKKSFKKISVKDIVNDCGLSKTSFYNHFRDKYDLIAWIYSTDAEKIMRKVDYKNYVWKNTLADWIIYSIENKNFLKNLILNTSGQDSFINYVANVNIKIMSDYIKRSQKIENLPTDIEISVKVYCYGTVCTLCEMILKDFPIPTEDFIKFLENALPEPLKKFLYLS